MKLRHIKAALSDKEREIAKNLLKDCRLVAGPISIEGVKAATEDKFRMQLIYDTPREYRHPEDYDEDEIYESPKFQRWEDAEEKIAEVVQKYEKKYPKYIFGICGGWNGPGIIWLAL